VAKKASTPHPIHAQVSAVSVSTAPIPLNGAHSAMRHSAISEYHCSNGEQRKAKGQEHQDHSHGHQQFVPSH
jgi:hypothetical protein